MADILDDLRNVHRLRGNYYSSAEVVGFIGRAADEIERVRELVTDAEIALLVWDDGRNSEYWVRHPERAGKSAPPMGTRGHWESLTPEQKEAALTYRGPENHGHGGGTGG